MHMNEMNGIFTQKVAAYIANGYTIHTQTMSGSQGEIAHVDLSKGKDIVRVLMESGITHGKDFSTMDIITIKVGRCTDKDVRWTGTIWNHKLETISEESWCKVSNTWVVGIEEGERLLKLRYSRPSKMYGSEQVELPEAAKSIVLPFIRRQPRCKSVTTREIEKVYKITYHVGTKYYVDVRGKTYWLH